MTGLGNYSRLVIESVARRFPSHTLRLYAPDTRDNPRLEPILEMSNVELVLPSGEGIMNRGAIWRSSGITRQLRADKIDLYHGLSNELPLNIAGSDIPSIVTIHDLIFRRLPKCYSLPDRLLYDFKYRASCRAADRIIAISQRTAADITELYGIDPDKIDIVYQGCAEAFKHPATRNTLANIREKYHLPTRYILQVGTIEKRKNLELTVKALPAIPNDVELVVVGSDRGYLSHVKSIARANGTLRRIHVYSNVAFSELPAIYQMSCAVVYPSRYEGFGIPVLEGLESNRPVIAGKGSCLEEAGGEAAFYVDPDSPREMAEAIKAALTDGPQLVSRLAIGKRHASRFSNAEIASRLETIYERTIRLKKG